MEHVSEGLHQAVIVGLFVLAVSVMALVGRSVDELYSAECGLVSCGEVIMEEK